MSDLIGKEVSFHESKFILKHIEEISKGFYLGYLEGESFNTTLSLSVLKIGNDFVDDLYKKATHN